MIDINISKDGIFSIYSITMGTSKNIVKNELLKTETKFEEYDDCIKIDLCDISIKKTFKCTLWLNINDIGNVCDGFILYDKLSFLDAKFLQDLYVKRINATQLDKIEIDKREKGEILYSFSNSLFKLDIVIFREGGESAEFPTQDTDYTVMVYLTSKIEQIKGIADVKRLLYSGELALKESITNQSKTIENNNKSKQNNKQWYILLCNTLAIIILFVCLLWPSKSTREPAEKKIGRYLYIDNANVLHTKNGCSAVYKERSMQPVEPILKEELNRQSLRRVCSKCVSEKQLDSLRWYVEYTDEGNDIDKDTWD